MKRLVISILLFIATLALLIGKAIGAPGDSVLGTVRSGTVSSGGGVKITSGGITNETGNYFQTNAVNGAWWRLGTNGHLWVHQPDGTEIKTWTNGQFKIIQTNGHSLVYSNGNLTITGVITGNGSGITNIGAASTNLPSYVVTNGGSASLDNVTVNGELLNYGPVQAYDYFAVYSFDGTNVAERLVSDLPDPNADTNLNNGYWSPGAIASSQENGTNGSLWVCDYSATGTNHWKRLTVVNEVVTNGASANLAEASVSGVIRSDKSGENNYQVYSSGAGDFNANNFYATGNVDASLGWGYFGNIETGSFAYISDGNSPYVAIGTNLVTVGFQINRTVKTGPPPDWNEVEAAMFGFENMDVVVDGVSTLAGKTFIRDCQPYSVMPPGPIFFEHEAGGTNTSLIGAVSTGLMISTNGIRTYDIGSNAWRTVVLSNGNWIVK